MRGGIRELGSRTDIRHPFNIIHIMRFTALQRRLWSASLIGIFLTRLFAKISFFSLWNSWLARFRFSAFNLRCPTHRLRP